MDELEAAVRSAKAADHSLEVQAAESRVRSLQGSLSRKEDTLRELRERMDQACRFNSLHVTLQTVYFVHPKLPFVQHVVLVLCQ